jgi:ribosomal protein S18 acetylase RimI-like enzyme
MKSALSNYSRCNADNLTFWYDKDELVAMVGLSERDGLVWIHSLYISPIYRKKGYCYSLLDYTTLLGGIRLSVRKTNKIAIYAYEKYGFIRYDEDNIYYQMKLKEDTL